jgi:hypothetical protein
MERLLGVDAFEIVGRIEQVLSAGLALPARQSAEAVEAPRDRRDEPALAAHIGGHRPEQRGRCLIGAIGPAKPLDCGVSPPARLEQEVDAAGLVLGGQIGMVAAPGSPGIGKDQDALGAVHERLGLGDVGARRPGLEFLTTIAADDEPARPAGHFRHLVDAEAFDDGIKRGGDRRQGAELLDHPVARGERRAAQHRCALLVAHRLGARIAVFVGEHRHQADRKALGEIVDHIFFAVAVYVERGGGRRRFPSVFHDFTPDNYSSFDLNKSKEPPCEQDHHCRFERPRSGSKTRPVTTPYSPHSSPLCRSTRGQPVRSCLALRPAISCIGWNCMGSQSARSTIGLSGGSRSIVAGATGIRRRSQYIRRTLQRGSDASSASWKIKATSKSTTGSTICHGTSPTIRRDQ